jgi:hypothetical protein
MTSAESLRIDDGAGATPCHGEIVIAFDPQFFSPGNFIEERQRAEKLFEGIYRPRGAPAFPTPLCKKPQSSQWICADPQALAA